MELVLRRCFPKISHLVSGVKHLFRDDLITRLESWERVPADALNFALIGKSRFLLSGAPVGEIWVKTPIVLHRVFDNRHVPKQLRDNIASSVPSVCLV
jgi:hypothetical protein